MTIAVGGSGSPRLPGDGSDVPEEVRLARRDLRRLPDCVCGNGRLRILDVSGNCLEEGSLRQLSELRGLIRLNVSGNGLGSLPAHLPPALEVLCASGNEIEDLGESVHRLQRLRRLHCDFNLLRSVPTDWSQLSSLTVLGLSHNRLEEVPSTLWTLQRLRVLDLRANRISGLGPLPEGAAGQLEELRLSDNRLVGRLDLTPLTNLLLLDVSRNNLEHLEVSKLEKLEALLASHNALKCLSLDGARLRRLSADANDLEKVSCQKPPTLLDDLSLSHNFLDCLPDWTSGASALTTLSAPHNRIAGLPKDLFALSHLRHLHLNHNLLSGLPELLAPCHLRTLSLQNNRIQQLPENFFLALPCLESLNLSFNLLQCLPPSYGTNTALGSLFLSGNRLGDLSDLANLLSGSRIETLYLSFCGLHECPDQLFSGLPRLRVLSLSGNGLHRVPDPLVQSQSLRKLYLHSNRIASVPTISSANQLQVLDLACNSLQQLELASIVPGDLTYLDLSANSQLQIDPADFHHLCCERSVSVVDVNCAGRQAPLTPAKTEVDSDGPWMLGFTESQEGNTRLYIEFRREEGSGGRQEALVTLLELAEPGEVGCLREALPDLLRAERDEDDFLRNALLTCVRFLRERRQYEGDVGITMCHLSSSSSDAPVTLRLGSVGGRPSSCALGRAQTLILLSQRQEATPVDARDWNAAMEATEVCCHNYLGSSPAPLPPRGVWSSVPEPEVRELVLSPQDRFLVFGDGAFSRTVPAEEVCRRVAECGAAPVAAAKSLSEAYAALAGGRRECVAVVVLRSDAPPPQEEEVEKYRCWEFMLEQNHKLLFTKELETLHHQPPNPPEPLSPSWYAAAFSKYKCPLPSHRGRYYCYGNKAD